MNEAGQPITTQTDAELNSRYLPWQPNTAYTAGTFVSNAGSLYTVDSNFTTGASFSTTGLTRFQAGGFPTRYRTGLGMWQYSAFIQEPTSTAWPTINRIYWCPFFFPVAVTISALGMNVSGAGTAANVVRMGLWNASSVDAPGTVIEEGTVAGDSTGNKTLTLATPRTVSGLIWVACGPQGATSPGSSLLAKGVSVGMIRPTDSDVSALWGGQYQNTQLYTTASGTIGDNPTVVLDASFSRFPLVAVRIS